MIRKKVNILFLGLSFLLFNSSFAEPILKPDSVTGVSQDGKVCRILIKFFSPEYDSSNSGGIFINDSIYLMSRKDPFGNEAISGCPLSNRVKELLGLESADHLVFFSKGVGEGEQGYETIVLTYSNSPTQKLIKGSYFKYKGGIFSCWNFQRQVLNRSQTVECTVNYQ